MVLGAGDADSYSAAHQKTIETGKPLVVMVSTDWCVPCQMMKKTVIPQIRKKGVFRKVTFAMVNPDRDTELAQQLTGGGPVPQLVMFRKTATGWRRRILVGGQSVETVEQFLKDGIAKDDDEADAKADAPKPTLAEKPESKAKKS
jgi:protein disulfide-isomerase